MVIFDVFVIVLFIVFVALVSFAIFGILTLLVIFPGLVWVELAERESVELSSAWEGV